MNDPHTPSGAATIPQADEPATYRLVIRAKIIAEEPPQEDRPHSHRRAFAMVGAGAATLFVLSWVAISAFRTEPSTVIRDRSAAAVSTNPEQPTTGMGAPPSAATVDAPSAKSAPVSAAPTEDAPPSPTHESLPTVPRSALQTIRGTVRVAVRVTIDQHGLVVAAATQDRGPSRYFERLALESSRNWTFTAAAADAPRNLLLRFYFTRDGVTAHATAL
jgi:hypothetical protein